MADGFVPPQSVRNNAKRGLELRQKYNRGGTEVGVARARDLSNGKSLSIETIKRMVSYFARHEVDKKGEGWGKDSAGYIAWLLWGGDSGRAWANKINDEHNAKEKSMTLDLAYSYAAILKSEKQSDGTLKVYGKATDDSIDIDQQICDSDWLKKAMPDWFTTGGNIREQHSSIAAGVATDYEEKADGHYITALVVDPVSVKKVETGVLKGFSIGIRGPRVVRDTKAAGGRIVDGQIIEVSIVDRPANPNAKLMLAKAADGGELMAVEQISIPTPADVFKSAPEEVIAAAEALADAPAVEETPVAEEVVADAPATEEAPAEETAIEEVATDEAIEAVKSLQATLKKFDQTLFDDAKRALSALIASEADEQANLGHNEVMSLTHLLESVKHLFDWYEGEEYEGEIGENNPTEVGETIEMSATLADDEKCGDCGKMGKMCKCNKAADADTDATEAEAEKSATVDVKFDESQISSILEKAVSSAKESVEAEFTLLKSSLAEAEQKAANLEAELETAKKMAVAGGPKRSILKSTETTDNELIQKAAAYRQFANTTQDTLLAKGYRELAADLEAKANSRKETA